MVDPRGMEEQGIDTLELVLYIQPKEEKDNTTNAPNKKNIFNQILNNKNTTDTEESITFYDINFIKGKSVILAKSRGALKYIYELMNEHPSLEIMIEGHTDNVGDEIALIDLSLQRAEAIRDYLVHRGIAQSRMQVSGKGATDPVSRNTSEYGREKNRRVEITIIKEQQ